MAVVIMFGVRAMGEIANATGISATIIERLLEESAKDGVVEHHDGGYRLHPDLDPALLAGLIMFATWTGEP
jgi:DNA-binding IscR family transcriptional regulator